MKKVKITGYMLRYAIGEVVELSEYKAESLIKAGIAEYVSNETKETETEKVVKAKK